MKLEVNELTRSFGKVMALDHVSFSIDSGCVYGFIGPNGAGKTTAMRIIATLDQPDSGDVICDGFSVLDYPERARRLIGYMPDTLPGSNDILVWEYLDFFIRCAGFRGAARRRQMAHIEEFTQLGLLRGKYLRDLSRGMKQRVSLARALVHNPRILILDEPTSGLDPRARLELRDLLRELAQNGVAILISSHILEELEGICNGVVVLERGRLLSAGPLQSLRRAEDGFIQLEVSVAENVDGAGLFLQEHPEVVWVRHSASPGQLVLKLRGDSSTGTRLMAELIESGHRVIGFRRIDRNLEDLFMHLTAGAVQ